MSAADKRTAARIRAQRHTLRAKRAEIIVPVVTLSPLSTVVRALGIPAQTTVPGLR
jgi:hypothetical protein